MTTRTVQIKQELDKKLEEIRGYADLSDADKRRRIAEAYEDGLRRYEAAIAQAEAEAVAKVSRAEKAVFGLRYPAGATEAEKAAIRASYRSAYGEAHYSTAYSSREDAERELAELLERADRSGDPELAGATYHAALQRDITSVVDRYLESRPEQKRHYDELTAARQEATATEQELWAARAYPLRAPAELNTPEAVG